jgi:hypothetical protein
MKELTASEQSLRTDKEWNNKEKKKVNAFFHDKY